MEIKIFEKNDTQDVADIVLHCQNDGTRRTVGIENNKDLLRIEEEYINSGGNFWVAKDGNKLAGTIGLIKYNDKIGILKKFFVYENYRGNPHYLGQKLYTVLLDYAITAGLKTIILDTPKNTHRAHKFYERAGFKKVEYADFPVLYNTPYPTEECDFFVKDLF